jgi:hypothetical protein
VPSPSPVPADLEWKETTCPESQTRAGWSPDPLLAAVGDNPGRLRTEASFAAPCGVSPVDASSGKQIRRRLNRGGDRQANSALWQIVMTRMSCDPRTKAYVARRTKEGKTIKEIMRCLKRYVAREVYKALVTHPCNTSRQVTRVAAPVPGKSLTYELRMSLCAQQVRESSSSIVGAGVS